VRGNRTLWLGTGGAALALLGAVPAPAQAAPCPPEANSCIGPIGPVGPAIGAIASFGSPVSPLMSLVYDKLSGSEREEQQRQIPAASAYVQEATEQAAEARARTNAARALDQLFGDANGGVPVGNVQEGRNADLPPPMEPSLFWMRGVARIGSSQQQGDAPAVDMHGGAGFIGLDLPYDAQTRFGVAAGYSRSLLDTDTDSKLNADGYHISGYVTHANGPWRMRAIATYAYYDLESRREILRGRETTEAKADYSANNVEALAEISYVAAFGAFALEPYVSVGISWLDTDGFQETVPEGASKEGLWGVQGHSDTWPYSILGARLTTQFDLAGAVVSPSLDLGWRHVYGDVTPDLVYTMPQASFAVSGIPIAEDSLLIGVGLDALLPSTGWRTSLKYIGEIAGDAQLHTFSAGLAIPF
jgi:outer membrane autotransporter protein